MTRRQTADGAGYTRMQSFPFYLLSSLTPGVVVKRVTSTPQPRTDWEKGDELTGDVRTGRSSEFELTLSQGSKPPCPLQAGQFSMASSGLRALRSENGRCG